MKRVLMITALLVASGGVIFMLTSLPPTSASGGLTIEQLIDIRHPSNAMWAPDGRHVAFVWDRAGVAGVYIADASTPSAPRALKDAGSQLAGAFWSADGRSLMIPKDGDLWRVPIDGGAASAVWTTPASESNIVASPDGALVAFVRMSSPPASGTTG